MQAFRRRLKVAAETFDGTLNKANRPERWAEEIVGARLACMEGDGSDLLSNGVKCE
jgi:hypothetical protein